MSQLSQPPCSLTKVYNFVLDTVHLININNIIACTFGHTIKGPVIGHDFYGTEAVINDLKKMRPKFRSYFQNIIDMILNEKESIRNFIENCEKKTSKKKTMYKKKKQIYNKTKRLR
jgi:hypothetical protein